MDEGAKMLDPDRWTIFKLHTEEWSLGQRAFAQEYENRIIDSSDKLLPCTVPTGPPSAVAR
jgi:hypothetical protein